MWSHVIKGARIGSSIGRIRIESASESGESRVTALVEGLGLSVGTRLAARGSETAGETTETALVLGLGLRIGAGRTAGRTESTEAAELGRSDDAHILYGFQEHCGDTQSDTAVSSHC